MDDGRTAGGGKANAIGGEYMKTAEQIMKKKAAMWAEVGKHLPKEQADVLWQQADRKSVV